MIIEKIQDFLDSIIPFVRSVRKVPTIYRLHTEQHKALLKARRGKNLFISGGAGTGKSYLLNAIAEDLSALGKAVVIVAPTGIAASHIGGATIHRTFGFRAGNLVSEKRNKLRETTNAVTRMMDVLIIDEISMVRMDLFDAMAATIRKVETQEGKHIQVIVFGDFCQLSPVIDTDHHDDLMLKKLYGYDIGRAYAFQAPSWDTFDFVPILLKEVMRQEDPELISKLNLARFADQSCIDYFNVCKNTPATPGAPTLYCYNRDVDSFNNEELTKIDGKEQVFYPVDCLENPFDRTDPKEIPAPLHLKVGAKVIITANSGTNYYHNGDIGIITRIFANEVQVGVLRPTDDGKLIRKEVLISNLTHKEYVYSVADGKLRKDLVAMYSDLPLKLAYALTIHRGQGQTYDAVNINPRCSLPGQLYVALSRVRDIKHMHLLYPIKPENLVAAPEVIEFYCKMELKAAGKLRKPLGRPKKYASGNKRIWVPTPLEKHIRKECDSVKALKMAVSPRYSSDRVQIRVPLELVDHVEEEIRNWKSQAK